MLELSERAKSRIIDGLPESAVKLFCPGLHGLGASLLDRSSTGANGTITGATWKHHPSGLYVLSFDGAGDKVVFGTAATFKFLHGALDTSPFQFTIEFLLQLPTPEPDTIYGLFDEALASSSNVGLSLYFDDRSSETRSRRLVCAIMRGASGQPVCSLVSGDDVYPNNTRFHHIAITYDQSLANTNGIIYVDGASVATGNKTANTPSTAKATNALTMGALADGSFVLVGRQGLPVIYNRALTPTEVLRHATRMLTLLRP